MQLKIKWQEIYEDTVPIMSNTVRMVAGHEGDIHGDNTREGGRSLPTRRSATKTITTGMTFSKTSYYCSS